MPWLSKLEISISLSLSKLQTSMPAINTCTHQNLKFPCPLLIFCTCLLLTSLHQLCKRDLVWENCLIPTNCMHLNEPEWPFRNEDKWDRINISHLGLRACHAAKSLKARYQRVNCYCFNRDALTVWALEPFLLKNMSSLSTLSFHH